MTRNKTAISLFILVTCCRVGLSTAEALDYSREPSHSREINKTNDTHAASTLTDIRATNNNKTMDLLNNPFLRPAWLPMAQERNSQEANTLATGLILRGTVTKATTPFALVNDQLLEVGQSVNGYQLLRIAEGSAVFMKNDKQLTLSVVGDNQ